MEIIYVMQITTPDDLSVAEKFVDEELNPQLKQAVA